MRGKPFYLIVAEVLHFLTLHFKFATSKGLRDNMASIPQLEFTNKDAIPDIVNGVRSTFYTQKTRPLEFRLVQLRKLYWG